MHKKDTRSLEIATKKRTSCAFHSANGTSSIESMRVKAIWIKVCEHTGTLRIQAGLVSTKVRSTSQANRCVSGNKVSTCQHLGNISKESKPSSNSLELAMASIVSTTALRLGFKRPGSVSAICTINFRALWASASLLEVNMDLIVCTTVMRLEIRLFNTDEIENDTPPTTMGLTARKYSCAQVYKCSVKNCTLLKVLRYAPAV